MHPRTLCSAHNLCNILREQAWFKLFKWESDVFVLITAFALYIYDICFFVMKLKEMLYKQKHYNMRTHSGKRETEAKFKSNLFRACFGTYFWSPFHLSWFTTAARVTLKKPPSCCQRQWHHCKRWGLCRIVIFVLLPTLISKSHLKLFLDPVNLRMTVMDLCIGQGWHHVTSFSPGLWQRSSTDPCGSCWSQCPTKKGGWVALGMSSFCASKGIWIHLFAGHVQYFPFHSQHLIFYGPIIFYWSFRIRPRGDWFCVCLRCLSSASFVGKWGIFRCSWKTLKRDDVVSAFSSQKWTMSLVWLRYPNLS